MEVLQQIADASLPRLAGYCALGVATLYALAGFSPATVRAWVEQAATAVWNVRNTR